MEVIPNVQFVYCYKVLRVAGVSPYTNFGCFRMNDEGVLVPAKPKIPDDVIEVYPTEAQAMRRSQTLAEETHDTTCPCKTSVTRHLAITTDGGKTVSILDSINTFTVKND